MNLVETDRLSTAVTMMKESADAAIQVQSAEDFCQFERQLNELDVCLREMQQHMWADDARRAVKNLESNGDLTPSDVAVIRTFLVSDAEYYLAAENNFQDWCHELNRLMSEIAKRIENINPNSIGELRGVLKDAIRLVPDIRNYLDELKRVKNFDANMSQPDTAARAMIARLIRTQLDLSTR